MLERLTQNTVQSKSSRNSGVHVASIKLEIISPLVLRVIHCRVGIFNQRVNVLPV